MTTEKIKSCATLNKISVCWSLAWPVCNDFDNLLWSQHFGPFSNFIQLYQTLNHCYVCRAAVILPWLVLSCLKCNHFSEPPNITLYLLSNTRHNYHFWNLNKWYKTIAVSFSEESSFCKMLECMKHRVSIPVLY